MKTQLAKLISTYKNDKPRLGQMLQSILNYILASYEVYLSMEENKVYPINKSGNDFMDALTKEIHISFEEAEDAKTLATTINPMIKEIEDKISSLNIIQGYKKSGFKIDPKKATKKPLKPQTVSTKEISYPEIETALANANRVYRVLNERPINPMHIPSCREHLQHLIESLEALQEKLN